MGDARAHQRHLAEPALIEDVAHKERLGAGALGQRDHELAARAVHLGHDLFRIGQADGERLFGVDVLVVGQGGLEHPGMVLGGAVDDDGVDVGAAQGGLDILRPGRAKALRGSVAALGIIVPNAADLGVGVVDHALGVAIGVDVGETEHGDADHV